ncbi:MAG: VWA domain-containing protein [Cellvibrionaceae bacterium]
MRRSRRDNGELNISFLDVICCGFGAIVLLLIIAKTVEPLVLESFAINLDGQVERLQKQLFEIRGKTSVFNRDMNAKQEQLSRERERIAILRTELAELEARHAKVAQDTSADTNYQGELELALQSLTEEMQRLLADSEQRNDLIGGIPVDSEYIIFVIDTSGSMFENAWPRVIQEMVNILSIYPEVKGIQIVNDMGEYMFPSFRNRWIPDTEGRRDAIVQRLRNWNAFSNSSPVEGIQMAIRTFYEPGKKISIYVFGDDLLPNASITEVANTIDRLNRRGLSEERLVRIHAVGFPVLFQLAAPHQQHSARRFAALMREVTGRNGGTFVGLNDYRPEE